MNFLRIQNVWIYYHIYLIFEQFYSILLTLNLDKIYDFLNLILYYYHLKAFYLSIIAYPN